MRVFSDLSPKVCQWLSVMAQMSRGCSRSPLVRGLVAGVLLGFLVTGPYRGTHTRGPIAGAPVVATMARKWVDGDVGELLSGDLVGRGKGYEKRTSCEVLLYRG